MSEDHSPAVMGQTTDRQQPAWTQMTCDGHTPLRHEQSPLRLQRQAPQPEGRQAD